MAPYNSSEAATRLVEKLGNNGKYDAWEIAKAIGIDANFFQNRVVGKVIRHRPSKWPEGIWKATVYEWLEVLYTYKWSLGLNIDRDVAGHPDED